MASFAVSSKALVLLFSHCLFLLPFNVEALCLVLDL